MALNCTGKFNNYQLAYQTAVESLESGAAFKSFNNLIALQG